MAILAQYPLPVLAISLGLVVFFIILTKQRHRPSNGLSLPPIPPGWPLIGNLPDLAKYGSRKEVHLLMEKWARQYGDIFGVRVGPVTEYFLNSDQAVKALLDKASASTSERPRWIVSNELLANQWSVLLMSASHPTWKIHRKLINSYINNIPRADAGVPFLEQETLQFLYEVCHDPSQGTDKQNLVAGLQRYTYSAFARQMVGLPWPRAGHHSMHTVFISTFKQILGTFPGAHLVDILPILGRLPLVLKPWEREARKTHGEDLVWARERMRRVKRLIESDRRPDSLLATALESKDLIGLGSEDEAAIVSVQLIAAAADTSQMSTWSFMEAMMMFPDVQKKAQGLIDDVVGERLPMWNDVEAVPYVRCLMKETWRWRPPVSLGHPHYTTVDLDYKGYLIPKGSRLHLNAWAISHDPARHTDPDRFWPERFENDLTSSLQSMNQADPSLRDHFAFGSGRRACAGINVAERSLCLAIIRLLWAFNIRPAPNAVLPLNPANYRGDLPGVASNDMPVTLTPRDAHRVAIIDAAHKTNEGIWDTEVTME